MYSLHHHRKNSSSDGENLYNVICNQSPNNHTKKRDKKRETGKRGTVKNAGSENVGLENEAPNCRTGKE